MPSASTLAFQDPRIASTIVAYTTPPFDVAALARTNKTLSVPATRLLYTTLAFDDVTSAYLALQAVAHTPAIAQHVRSLQLYRDRHRPRVPLPSAFWHALQLALTALPALETLVLADMSGGPSQPAHTSVLPPQAPFRLRDARILLPWGPHLAAFLAHQPSLRTLQIEAFGGPPSPASPASAVAPSSIRDHLPPEQPILPNLTVFEGPLRVAHDLAASPLTHLQVCITSEPRGDPESLLPVLRGLRGTLRALNIQDMPESRAADIIGMVGAACPQLLHLGSLTLPPGNRMPCHAALRSFEKLRSLELDLALWNPPPPFSLQRALVAETHTYSPTLEVAVVWLSNMRVVWMVNPETGSWEGRHDGRGGWKAV
ncbi:hypothetical protein DENSPDRAFT_838519 [Dentipellis sp. KUC8613]|nr:hypothetical protein DENSPDRAFT_838519 [Dentipellis sp. KUC8613]